MSTFLSDTLALSVSVAVIELESCDFIPRHYRLAFRNGPQLLCEWGDKIQFHSKDWYKKLFEIIDKDFEGKDWAAWPAYVTPDIPEKRGTNSEFHFFENLTRAEAFSEIAKALAVAAFAVEEIRVGGCSIRGQSPKIRRQAAALAGKERQRFRKIEPV